MRPPEILIKNPESTRGLHVSLQRAIDEAKRSIVATKSSKVVAQEFFASFGAIGEYRLFIVATTNGQRDQQGHILHTTIVITSTC